jgi:hypothetical protein
MKKKAKKSVQMPHISKIILDRNKIKEAVDVVKDKV